MKFILTFAMMAFSIVSCLNTGNQEKITTPGAKSEMAGNNTVIVDVRTVEEWDNDGHAACSINYPLDIFASKIDSLRKFDSVVLVCRSGSRAGSAMRMLQDAGFKNVQNMGPWQNIQCSK